MLKLTRAMAPDEMEPRPCGAAFPPRAVLCNHVTMNEYLPTCEACVDDLAERAEREDVPADWGEVRRLYRLALERYPAPVFPSVSALLEAEDRESWGPFICEIGAAELAAGTERKGDS